MIRNETKSTVLAEEAIPVKGFIRQGLGLMFRKSLDNQGLVFLLPRESRWDVTNLFVFQAIDVLWLDKDQKVRKLARAGPFKPRIKGIKGTRYLVEVKDGTVKRTGTTLGDRLTWDFKGITR